MCLLDQEPSPQWSLKHLLLPTILLWWDIERRPISQKRSALNILARSLLLVVVSKCPLSSFADFTFANTCLLPQTEPLQGSLQTETYIQNEVPRVRLYYPQEQQLSIH